MRRAARHLPVSPLPAPDKPFALTTLDESAQRLAAVNPPARARGMRQDMVLADARAVFPGLITLPIEPARDACALDGLALWCERYAPSVSVDATDGLLLDITGCAHLFGGEDGLIADLSGRLTRLEIGHSLGVSDTPGAAWAIARYGDAPIAAPGKSKAALAGLPIAGLRLGPSHTKLLHRLGFKRIGQLYDIPRPALERRFRARKDSAAVLARLDQALGRADDPLTPLRPAPVYAARLAFGEPVLERAAIDQALGPLSADLCAQLVRDRQGARRLVLQAFRVDGLVTTAACGLGVPSQDAGHLCSLLEPHLDCLDAGFGIDLVCLSAPHTAPVDLRQTGLERGAQAVGDAGDRLARLADRLMNRLGADHVIRLAPVDRHRPERAQKPVAPAGIPAAADAETWPDLAPAPRPLLLLERPEPVEVMASVPDGPPVRFLWRKVARRVVKAEGPERIEPEWWDLPQTGAARDYYHVEDETGRRFWLYRDGLYQTADSVPPWYMHGFFP